MSDMQKIFISMLFGATLVVITTFLMPKQTVTETKIVVVDNIKLPDNWEQHTLDIQQFISKATKREMKIEKFLGVLKKCGYEYEATYHDDDYVWYEIFSDMGSYRIGVAPNQRIFTWKEDF